MSTSPETTSDVVIAGAGIACLTAALTLNAQGIRPVILESTREIEPLGVGINLQPPAVEVLTRLGLREHLEKLGVPTSSARYLTREGTLLARAHLLAGRAADRCAPRRTAEHAARHRSGAPRIRRGAHRSARRGFELSDGVVNVTVTDRDSEQAEKVTARVLLAADGVHS